jgi:hypothetical protein
MIVLNYLGTIRTQDDDIVHLVDSAIMVKDPRKKCLDVYLNEVFEDMYQPSTTPGLSRDSWPVEACLETM